MKIDIESILLDPVLKELISLTETIWINPKSGNINEGLARVGLSLADARDAEDRLSRFAPFIMKAFPETAATNGIIESDIVVIPEMQASLNKKSPVLGSLWLKKDSHLPISGSIKARGGIYEVLSHAEKLALDAGLITVNDDYGNFLSPEFKKFFGQYKVAVGSTGNLGLSIGIVSAKLGFQSTVHLSSDASEWKKEKLRSSGVEVIEYEDDYSVAVEEGRKSSETDPSCFFIDDENSKTLFLGYSVAGLRLKEQLKNKGIKVDTDHPLFVYLPCGVGGGPGGVAFGLKLIFGDNVHCFFAEPTHSPCMLLGMSTGLHDEISVKDIGLDNKTDADGLAVGRASGFVGRAMELLISGCYTLSDQSMYDLLAELARTENIKLEPSALAGMRGPQLISKNAIFLGNKAITQKSLNQSTHLVWATGGSMVPEDKMQDFISRGYSSTSQPE